MRKTCLHRTWNRREGNSTTKDRKFAFLAWQSNAIATAREANRIILKGPMGSGKTVAGEGILIDHLHRDRSRFGIIAVPQTAIGSCFRARNLPMPDGSAGWDPVNFCTGRTEQLVRGVLEILSEPPAKEINKRVLVCTHATLVAAWRQLKRIPPVFLWLDEAHHCRTSELAKSKFNELGRIVNQLVGDPAQKIGLCTARFFRGDRHPIIRQEHLREFVRIERSWEEQLSEMLYLRGVTYDFITYEQDPCDALGGLLTGKQPRTLLYLPYVTSEDWDLHKSEQVLKILQMIAGDGGSIEPDAEQGLIRIRQGKHTKVVVNLVEYRRHREKLQYLSNFSENQIDYVIALGRCKEGFDLPPAERVIIIGNRCSAREVIQTVGRVFRDYPGKDIAQICHLVPWSLELGTVRARRMFNNYLRAIYTGMLLNEAILPSCRIIQSLGGDESANRLDAFVRDGLAQTLNGEMSETNFRELVAKHFAVAAEELESAACEMKRFLLLEGTEEKSSLVLISAARVFERTIRFFGEEFNVESLARIKTLLQTDECVGLTEAAKCIRSRNISTRSQYAQFAHKYPTLRLPSNPAAAYRYTGWDCWDMFLDAGFSPKWEENFDRFKKEISLINQGAMHAASGQAYRWFRLQKAKAKSGELTAAQLAQIQSLLPQRVVTARMEMGVEAYDQLCQKWHVPFIPTQVLKSIVSKNQEHAEVGLAKEALVVTRDATPEDIQRFFQALAEHYFTETLQVMPAIDRWPEQTLPIWLPALVRWCRINFDQCQLPQRPEYLRGIVQRAKKALLAAVSEVGSPLSPKALHDLEEAPCPSEVKLFRKVPVWVRRDLAQFGLRDIRVTPGRWGTSWQGFSIKEFERLRRQAIRQSSVWEKVVRNTREYQRVFAGEMTVQEAKAIYRAAPDIVARLKEYGNRQFSSDTSEGIARLKTTFSLVFAEHLFQDQASALLELKKT